MQCVFKTLTKYLRLYFVPRIDECKELIETIVFPAVMASFPALLRDLDANMQTLGASSYGVTSSSLEEIFLKVPLMQF